MKMQGRTAGDFQSVQFHNKMNGVWMIYSTLEVMTGGLYCRMYFEMIIADTCTLYLI